MKTSRLIAILAQHMVEYGDQPVFISPTDLKDPYREVTHCWYNHGKDWNEEDRIIVSGGA